MKGWKNYLVSLLAVAGFVACSDDDNPGLAPVVDNADMSVELKRDTIDRYRINLPITSEEGLVKVSLIDNTTSKTLDEQVSFSNSNDYTYSYDLDLTPYTENTVLMLTLKIEDKAGQIVSKKITLTIKKFSELEVRFATESAIVSQFEDCNLKVTVVRGMIPLKKIDVYVGSNLSDSFDLTLDSEQSKYELNVLVAGLVLGDNTVKVVVVDSKEQSFERQITVNRVKVKDRKSIKGMSFNNDVDDPDDSGAVGVEMNNEMYGGLPGTDKLYRLSFNLTTGVQSIDFEYEGDRVSKMSHIVWDIDWDIFAYIKASYKDYNYRYNADGELEKVTMSRDGSAATDYITDVVYESGNIKSYKIDGKEYAPKYIEKDGAMIRADYLDEDLSGFTYDLTRVNPNPMYMSELPAVVPGDVCGYDLNNLYNRYLFNSLKDGDVEKINYTVSDIQRDEEEYEGVIYVTIWQSVAWTALDGKNKTMNILYRE